MFLNFVIIFLFFFLLLFLLFFFFSLSSSPSPPSSLSSSSFLPCNTLILNDHSIPTSSYQDNINDNSLIPNINNDSVSSINTNSTSISNLNFDNYSYDIPNLDYLHNDPIIINNENLSYNPNGYNDITNNDITNTDINNNNINNDNINNYLNNTVLKTINKDHIADEIIVNEIIDNRIVNNRTFDDEIIDNGIVNNRIIENEIIDNEKNRTSQGRKRDGNIVDNNDTEDLTDIIKKYKLPYEKWKDNPPDIIKNYKQSYENDKDNSIIYKDKTSNIIYKKYREAEGKKKKERKDWIKRKIPRIKLEELEKINKNKWKTEGLCRKILEKIFEKEFPTKRPDFLKNPLTGQNLELDCYNEELKLALEYNGEQHYKYPNKFHNNKIEFKKQIQRDELKKTLCDINGITLIIVPYNIPKSKIIKYILEKLIKANYIDF